MSTIKQTVAEALHLAKYWDVAMNCPWDAIEAATFRAQIYISSNIFRYVDFSYTEIVEHHPDLPYIIYANRQAHIDREEGTTARGFDVNFSLDLAAGSCLEFIDDRGAHQTVAGVTNLESHPAYPSCLIIRGFTLNTHIFSEFGREVRYVSSSKNTTCFAPVDQLNTTYPGWQLRWEQCQALDLQGDPMLKHVFAKAIAPTTSDTLPEINFE